MLLNFGQIPIVTFAHDVSTIQCSIYLLSTCKWVCRNNTVIIDIIQHVRYSYTSRFMENIFSIRKKHPCLLKSTAILAVIKRNIGPSHTTRANAFIIFFLMLLKLPIRSGRSFTSNKERWKTRIKILSGYMGSYFVFLNDCQSTTVSEQTPEYGKGLKLTHQTLIRGNCLGCWVLG